MLCGLPNPHSNALWFAQPTEQWSVGCPTRTLCSAHCTLHTVHCTLYTVHSTLYTLHCTLYTVFGVWSFGVWSLGACGSAPYEKSKSLGGGGRVVARLTVNGGRGAATLPFIIVCDVLHIAPTVLTSNVACRSLIRALVLLMLLLEF